MRHNANPDLNAPLRALGLAAFVLLALLALLWLLAGCGSAETPAPAVAPEAAPSATVVPLESALVEVLPSPTPVAASDGVTLTWWTSPSFSPFSDDEAGRLVADAIQRLEEENPGLTVQTVLKAPYGRGGLLDFLLTTQKAAPALLPDVITLSGEDMAVAQRAGLLQPLEALLSPNLQSDLYPFALEEGRFDDDLLAVQFDADIEHTAVNSRRLPTVPRTWDDILDSAASYVFPTGSEGNPGDAFLAQYLGAGGQIGGRNAPFVLDEVALFEVLSFYEQGRRRGIIPVGVLGLDTAEASWSQISGGRADVAHVLASRYLAERAQHPELQFGPLPTQEDTPAIISRGWTLALVAADPERQEAAGRLMEALLDPQLNSRWAMASNRLPTRRSALALWDQNDPYVPFLHWHLEAAVARPSGAGYVEASRRLAEAQRAVLGGSQSAQEATEQATGMEMP